MSLKLPGSMPLPLSNEITAIATAVLAAFAIVTVIYAVRAFRKQSQQVRDLASLLKIQSDRLTEQRRIDEEQAKVLTHQVAELQESLEDRKREAEGRRSAQAWRVFIRLDGFAENKPRVYVTNNSEGPVYRPEVFWHSGPGSVIGRDFPDMETIMPGETSTLLIEDERDMSELHVAVIFRDAAGVTWMRNA